MKKLTCLLLTLVMLLSVCAMAEAADLSGEWYLLTMTEGDTEYAAADFGLEMILTLNTDGTASMATTGEEGDSATWVATAAGADVIAGDETISFVLVDGNLVAEQDGTKMTFGREAAEAFNPGSPITTAAVEDFNGKWICTKVEVMGMVVPADVMEVDAELAIENGSVTLTGSLSGGRDAALPATFADGALSMSLEGLGDMVVRLHDSGLLTLEVPYVSDMNMTLYCEAAE